MENRAHVAVLTDTHLFRGTIVLPGQLRLSDILNSNLSDVVELSQVKVYRYADLDGPAQSFPALQIRKQRILIVAILRENPRLPQGATAL